MNPIFAKFRYFKKVFSDLNRNGLFVLDMMGGPDAQEITTDKTRRGSFTYLWEQAYFNPINHHLKCYIHFRLDSGELIEKAFTYNWRLWSIPEIEDLLEEAGFSEVRVYWEDEDQKGEGSGTFRHRKIAENTLSWVAYIVGIK